MTTTMTHTNPREEAEAAAAIRGTGATMIGGARDRSVPEVIVAEIITTETTVTEIITTEIIAIGRETAKDHQSDPEGAEALNASDTLVIEFDSPAADSNTI